MQRARMFGGILLILSASCASRPSSDQPLPANLATIAQPTPQFDTRSPTSTETAPPWLENLWLKWTSGSGGIRIYHNSATQLNPGY